MEPTNGKCPWHAMQLAMLRAMPTTQTSPKHLMGRLLTTTPPGAKDRVLPGKKAGPKGNRAGPQVHLGPSSRPNVIANSAG